jgi:hypothetical protein
MSSLTSEDLERLKERLARRHHLFGWCCLLTFLSLGLVLETLHGLKVGFYLDPSHKLRRELWRLAHAHGTLLSLVQLAFAYSLAKVGSWSESRLKLASFFLMDAGILMPLGFFLGGLGHSEMDPSMAILLVPLGGVLLFAAVALVIWSGVKK